MAQAEGGALRASIVRRWTESALPSLSGLIEIPAVSPAYDPGWAEAGQLAAAVEHVRAWADGSALPGVRAEVFALEGRSPVLLVEVPATADATARGTVLLYGHLDKQPALGEWSAGLGPWRAVRRGDRLYGRGAVDDGYAGYAALVAIAALRETGGAHARAVVLLETGEESGSPDLPAYLDALADRLGEVTLVVGLDSAGADDRRLWLTTSLRGAVMATVTVRVLDSAVHSGLAGGIVPDPFRVLRALLDRLEDPATGAVTLPEMNVPVPAARAAEAAELAASHPGVAAALPLHGTARAAHADDTALILANTWQPSLTVVGMSGFPPAAGAPAVHRDAISARLLFRTPPGVSAAVAAEALTRALTTDPPYGAAVETGEFMLIDGWNEPERAPWLEATLRAASERVYGAPPGAIGIGGGIPFIELLGRRYPGAQFVVTGAASTVSNMHVPDEWLSITGAHRISEVVAELLRAHGRS